MSNRPAVTGWIKSKDTGNNINLFAFWDGEYGLSGRFSDEVCCFTVETQSGEKIEIKPDQVYLNGKLESQYLANTIATEKGEAQPAVNVEQPSSDNIPF